MGRCTRNLILALCFAAMGAQAGNSPAEKEYRIAASIGDTEAVERFLDSGVPVDSPNEIGMTALMMAVQNGNIDTVALLLNRGASVYARASGGCTPMTFAAENGHIALTALLLEKGASVHDRTRAGWDPFR